MSGHSAIAASRRARRIPGLRAHQVARVLAELSDLLEAGCQVGRALAVLIQQTEDAPLRRLVESLHQDIIDGASLADAMANAGEHFGDVQVAMIRAAETGGFLQQTLRHMADHTQQQLDMVRRIKASMTYPAVLMLTAVGSIIFLLSFVVPRFTAIYGAAQETLPWPTQILLDISGFFARYWWACIVAVVLAVLGLRLAWRNEDFRARADRAALRLPLIGPLISVWSMSQFARTMGLLLDGGLSALRSLTLTSRVLANRALRQEVADVARAVEQGESIGKRIRAGRMFAPSMAELIAIGEESGKLADVLNRLSEQYRRKFEIRLSTLVSLVEPAVILIVGVLIGLIVAALLLPVLLMNTLVG